MASDTSRDLPSFEAQPVGACWLIAAARLFVAGSSRDEFPVCAVGRRFPRTAEWAARERTARALKKLEWSVLALTALKLIMLALLVSAVGCAVGCGVSVPSPDEQTAAGLDPRDAENGGLLEGDSGRPTNARRPARPMVRDTGYVGSDACLPCHREIADRYRSHPMAHSFVRLDRVSSANGPPSSPAPSASGASAGRSPAIMAANEFPELEALPVAFRRGAGREYGVELRAGQLWHRESLAPLYDQAEPIGFAIGSGRRGRSYVLNRGGWLTLSPISWYATERRWDLSPEYDPESHPRFDRPVADRCLQCHAGRVEPATAAAPLTGDVARYSQRVATELAIGCERCHGPGARHVKKHGTGLASAAGQQRQGLGDAGRRAAQADASPPADDSICNPARLPAERADDVCNQCHLSNVPQVLRYGRRHSDFRPGDRLADIWLTFPQVEPTSPAAGDGAVQAVSHVWQTHSSRCYQQSQGELRCVSCHDPHGIPDDRSRVAFFDSKCLKCHSTESCGLPPPQRAAPPADGSCIGCHMPRLPAADVPHTTQTDHRIPRNSGHARRLNTPTTAPANTPRPTFEGVPAWEVERGRALLAAQQAEHERSPALARQVLEQIAPLSAIVADDAELLDARAICRLLVGQRPDAIHDWERLLALDPQRLSALQSLLGVHMEAGETTRAVGYAERLATLQPHQADVLLQAAVLAERLGRFEQAAELIERAWRLNPASAAIRARRAALRDGAAPPSRAAEPDAR